MVRNDAHLLATLEVLSKELRDSAGAAADFHEEPAEYLWNFRQATETIAVMFGELGSLDSYRPTRLDAEAPLAIAASSFLETMQGAETATTEEHARHEASNEWFSPPVSLDSLYYDFATFVGALIDGSGLISQSAKEYEVRMVLARYRDLARARAASARAEAAAVSAKRSADASAKAAGESATRRLTAHFGSAAELEAGQAKLFRRGTIGLFLAITAFSTFWLYTSSVQNPTFADLVKLAVTVPVALLAGYCARQASRHRINYEQFGTIEIQLLTLDAYLEPLPASSAQQVRLSFAERIFGTLVFSQSDKTPVDDVTEVLDKLGKVLTDLQTRQKS